jgi:hypothetical protein
MTFLWFGWGKSFQLRSFAMTGAFLIFPLVCITTEESYTLELSPLQMLVGAIALNTLNVIEPSDPNALSILILGYVCQGLGMAIAFIVSLERLPRYDFLPMTTQFITVHFYRAIRYGFHRCVYHVPCGFSIPFI